MVEINLLPWRDIARAKKKKYKIIFCISLLSFSFIIWMFNYFHESYQSDVAMQSKKDFSKETSQSDDHAREIQKLKFVGFISQGDQFWGLLMLPNGQTRDVQSGSFIHDIEASVKSINENNMVLMFKNQEEQTIQRSHYVPLS